MKVVLLAGGLGSRLSEETYIKPKPLIEIGNMPVIWHIMMIYSHYGYNEFIICCGYKGYMLKEFFANYFLHLSDVEIDVKSNSVKILNKKLKKNWKITLIDTGEKTQTGGRIKKIRKYIDDTFLMTYGDGLSNVNINKLLHFHKKNKSLATMTVVNPPTRFGSVQLKKNLVTKFSEKPIVSNSWINGGYFVLEPKIFDYISSEDTIWEKEPLKNLSKDKKLSAYLHKDFWQPMDTLRDRNFLNDLWNSSKAPWKLWK